MDTDWFTVLFTSQNILLDGALVHDKSVYTIHLIPAHTNIFKDEGWDFNSGNYLFTTDTK